MDPLSIIIGTGITASLVGLAFLSGHEYGKKSGITTERNLANLRVNALLERENRRAPRTGERPCLPANALLAVCERLAEGGTPSLKDRVVAVLSQLRISL